MRVCLPAGVLSDVLAPVIALVNEVVVHADEDKLVVHALGADKTVSVTVTLPTETCTTYSSSGQSFGINVQRLTTVLDHFSATTPVIITAPPNSARFTLSTSDATYCADCIDPNTIYQRTQDDSARPPAAVFTIPSESTPLKQSLIAADLCSETITVNTQQTNSAIQFTATGNTDSMTSQLAQDDILASYGTSTRATYPVNRLLPMHDALNSRTDRLHFSIDTTATLRLTATHTDSSATTRYTLLSHTTTSAE